MFNMFVVDLAPFKSHCYFLFIYHVKNIDQVSLTYIFETVISCIVSLSFHHPSLISFSSFSWLCMQLFRQSFSPEHQSCSLTTHLRSSDCQLLCQPADSTVFTILQLDHSSHKLNTSETVCRSPLTGSSR